MTRHPIPSRRAARQRGMALIPENRKTQGLALAPEDTAAEKLVKAGVKELLVISQDTSAYGIDIRYAENH